ncbi:unnamed protein product (macronuclear) [Paramecium tetraurelia]|uniref:Transmembrane protein n=1 Tax=Paramecium tetraurelia TaxID=5888 RepID=A0DJJ4_PARTE|nr:uncharacterized protein GSPATT00017555001 [Paramecium tetraurelia]CAK83211.1 unnamed protein product [Paramecium tetraurelia]|eukprot:XP_001450608.1 hypothetical protein (macronuclear) [Paramecium tetraurelia strain d4-2]
MEVQNKILILNKSQEMEILRRQVYSLNKILESYLYRNVVLLFVISKTKQFLQQWYDLIRSYFKYFTQIKKMIQFYLYELLKYTQKYQHKVQQRRIILFLLQRVKQVLEQLNGFKCKVFFLQLHHLDCQHPSREVWSDIIIGNKE